MLCDTPFSRATLIVIGPSITDSVRESQSSCEDYERWLLVWVQTLATELSQFFNCIEFVDPQCRLIEAGDCLRAIVALCLINEMPIATLLRTQSYGQGFDRFEVLNEAFGLVELAKKQTCPLNNEPSDNRRAIAQSLRVIFGFLADEVDLRIALRLLSDRLN